jgi:hypothetical protein
MSSEVPIEIEEKPTSVSAMRELVEHLQDTIEALKREIVRNPRATNTEKLSRAPASASPSPNKSSHVKRQEHRTHHRGSDTIALSASYGPFPVGLTHSLKTLTSAHRRSGRCPEFAIKGSSRSRRPSVLSDGLTHGHHGRRADPASPFAAYGRCGPQAGRQDLAAGRCSSSCMAGSSTTITCRRGVGAHAQHREPIHHTSTSTQSGVGCGATVLGDAAAPTQFNAAPTGTPFSHG